MLAATQAYWRKYQKTKVREQLLHRWKEEQSTQDNTDHLGEDEGLSQTKKLTPEEQHVKDEALLALIPFGFASVVVNEMYKNETSEIKLAVDAERMAEQGPMESEVDLYVRKKRLVKADGKIDGINAGMDQMLKNIYKATGFRGIIILGGPVPSKDGDLSVFGYGYGEATSFPATHKKKFNEQFLKPFGEYIADCFPEDVRQAHSLKAVEAEIQALASAAPASSSADPITSQGDVSLEVPLSTVSKPPPKPRKRQAKNNGRNQVWKPAKEFLHLPVGVPSFINNLDTPRFSVSPSSLGRPADLPRVSAPAAEPVVPVTTPIDSDVPASFHPAPFHPAPFHPTPFHPTDPAPFNPVDPIDPAPFDPVDPIDPAPFDPVDPIDPAPFEQPDSLSAPTPTSAHASTFASVTPIAALIPTPSVPASTAATPVPLSQIDPSLLTVLIPTATQQTAATAAPFTQSTAVTPAPVSFDTRNFPDWLRKASKYLIALDSSPLWTSLLKAFFEYESSFGFPTGAKFIVSWVAAPQVLTWWQEKAKQNVAKLPSGIPSDFGKAVHGWWLELQPEWRHQNLSQDTPPNFSWAGDRVAGPCGMFLVVMCMSWWLPFVTETDRVLFTLLANDITWFFRQSGTSSSAETNLDGGVDNDAVGSATRSRGNKRKVAESVKQLTGRAATKKPKHR